MGDEEAPPPPPADEKAEEAPAEAPPPPEPAPPPEEAPPPAEEPPPPPAEEPASADEAPAEPPPEEAEQEQPAEGAPDEAGPDEAVEDKAEEPSDVPEAGEAAEKPSPDDILEGDQGLHEDEKASGEIKSQGSGTHTGKSESLADIDKSQSRKSSKQTIDGDSIMDFGKTRSSVDVEQSFSQLEPSGMSLGGEPGGTRKDKLSARAKAVLGSVIDIKSQLTGDGGDRRVARYMNTYKLDSNNPFNPEKVHKILEEVMVEALENLSYDTEKCPTQAKWASTAIRAKVKQLDFERYKLVCIVSIGEKNNQDVLATCRFLWDTERDRYSTFSLENTYVFGIAYCFGLYYE